MSGPVEGDYYIENNRHDRNDNHLYASVYKNSGKAFTAEPKTPGFYQVFTLQYVNKAEGTYTIKVKGGQASGVDELKNAEHIILMGGDQDWIITKMTNDHYLILQKQGQTQFVWDLKDPGANDHQIVINLNNSSPYQLWAFRKV